ncbi:MAG: hypothetical protein GC157_01165 [Frankiales bacterium]|nr:hypothetical protein [Frankiales bacterium]
MTENTAALLPNGRSVLDPKTHLGGPQREPKSAPALVALLAQHDPAVASAAEAYAAALAAAEAARDAGAEIAQDFQDAQAAYQLTVRSGDAKAKEPDATAAIAAAHVAHRSYAALDRAASHAATALDEAVDTASVGDARAAAHAAMEATAETARTALAAAEQAVAATEQAARLLREIDRRALIASGVRPTEAAQDVDNLARQAEDDRVLVARRTAALRGGDLPLALRIPTPTFIEGTRTPAPDRLAATRAAENAEAARRRSGLPSGRVGTLRAV